MKALYKQLYESLLAKHGPQKWWPVKHSFAPQEFEICVGAILTQNTSWRNAEKALQNLSDAKITSADKIAEMPLPKLQKLIKPSGFYRQKSKRLKNFCVFVKNFNGNFYKEVTREQLLALNGIGRETADSILLYACGRPCFVVDAYTRRMLSRLGLIGGGEGYEEIRQLFEKALPKDVNMFREFHALIVEDGKAHARNPANHRSRNRAAISRTV
ncbi:MAG: endonuclease [Candidatus Aenigmarchaeota archaeon]|nr:endonuclease [Candidatus Aenigmarchaeota archaeon]